MRLRARFAAEMKSRLTASLPEALETVWDHQAVVVAVEQIKFTSAGGVEGDWGRKATLAGVVRAELRADEIDALEVEPLIADLLARPVHLPFDTALPAGHLSEKARFVLADWRDVIRDTQIASALRFTVEATIAAHLGPHARPELLIGQAPDIGPGHAGDYTPLEA
ncbi:MAG: hypothetical protein ACK5LJ_11260 [Paracoccus sp. (in: a-proteobacteria)]